MKWSEWILLTPFLVQGLVMAVDEFHFHWKRGLPLWERVGHPLDSLTVLICLVYLDLVSFSVDHLWVYVGLCAFSCLFITKDEFVHTTRCSAGENWLHAVLFLLHPLTFLAAAIFWQSGTHPEVITTQSFLVAGFLIYQVLYWGLRSGEKTEVNNSIYETYGDRWYTAFDDPVALLRAESKTKTPWILKQIRSRFPEARILDVGCGGGFLSNALAKEGYHVTGVDLSPESLKVAARFDSTGQVKYLVADAFQLPFPDASFEVLTAMDFLEHIEDPARVIQEFSRVLKPGGLFIFHTFNRNPLAWLVIIKFVEWMVDNTPSQMHVLRLFIKPRELSEYCLKANLLVREMTGIKPVVSSVPIGSLFSGSVPPGMRFELTRSLLLSYMGCAEKSGAASPSF